jgi:hypothetical protein
VVLGIKTDKHLPQSPFIGQICKKKTFCIAFYESYLSTEPKKTINKKISGNFRFSKRLFCDLIDTLDTCYTSKEGQYKNLSFPGKRELFLHWFF